MKSCEKHPESLKRWEFLIEICLSEKKVLKQIRDGADEVFFKNHLWTIRFTF